MRQNRDRLFRTGRPLLRRFESRDVNWLWVAYRNDGGNQDEVTFKEDMIVHLESQWDRVTMAEDRNAGFESGAGPVGLFHATFDDWVLQPHVTWFPWASTRNKLRCTVQYLMQLRNSRNIGVALVRAIDRNWFARLKKYVPIYPVGKVPHGHPDGDEFWFYVRCRKTSAQGAEIV